MAHAQSEFSRVFAALRKESGLTWKELAIEMQYSRSSISQVLTAPPTQNKPAFETMCQVFERHGCDPEMLAKFKQMRALGATLSEEAAREESLEMG